MHTSKGMRRIMVASPLKDGAPKYYIKTLLELFASKVPDIKFRWVSVGSGAVQWARDEIGSAAIEGKDDEVIMLDSDLQPTIGDWATLVSRDVDIVCALYSKRNLDTIWNVVGDEKGEARSDGLLPVVKVALGFSKIKTSVFKRLKEHFPERQYWRGDIGAEPVQHHEFFPMGIIGPNSDRGKLKRVRQALSEGGDGEGVRAKIESIINDNDYSTNELRGEDFYFCELCREAGIPIYLDSHIMVKHTGETEFPIDTKKLLQMLEEPWRADERRALTAQKPTQETLIAT